MSPERDAEADVGGEGGNSAMPDGTFAAGSVGYVG